MKISLLTVPAFFAVSALLLAGCSSDSKPADATKSPEVSVSPTPTNDTPSAEPTQGMDEDASADPASAAGLTAPGTVLAIGDTANVTWERFDGTNLTVSVAGVRTGAMSDFDGVGLSDDTKTKLAGNTPYYVDITFKKYGDSSKPLAFTSPSTEFDALNGRELALLGGDFTTCKDDYLTAAIDEGATETTCLIIFVPDGEPFGGMMWNSSNTVYADYGGDPVLWK